MYLCHKNIDFSFGLETMMNCLKKINTKAGFWFGLSIAPIRTI